MELQVRIKMNEKLYLRNPEDSVIGRKIVVHGIKLINRLGFEDFTFKKLANEIKTTEATIYRYFENKHRLLVYLMTWYWSFLEFKVMFSVNNLKDPETKLRTIIRLIVEEPPAESGADFLTEIEGYKLVLWDGSKTFLTRNVSKDNKDRLFKPYKDLCARIADIIKEYNPRFQFSHSLASTVLEMAHAQKFFRDNLPSLTDFPKDKEDKKLILFLETLLFNTIGRKHEHQRKP